MDQIMPFYLTSTCTLEKAAKQKKGLAQLEGILSTQSVDTQGEELIIKGMDISYLNSGYAQLNWWHLGRKDPSMVIGVIDEAKKINNDTAVYFKAHLFDTSAGRAAYELMQAFEQEGKTLGVSVEGATLLREGSKIFKSVARGAALATDQVNKECTAMLCKAIMGFSPSDDIDTADMFKAIVPTGDAVYNQNPTTTTNLGIESSIKAAKKKVAEKRQKKSIPVENPKGENIGSQISKADATAFLAKAYPTVNKQYIEKTISDMKKDEKLFLSMEELEKARQNVESFAMSLTSDTSLSKAVDSDFYANPEAAILNEDSIKASPDAIVTLAAFTAQAVDGLQKAMLVMNEKLETLAKGLLETNSSVMKAQTDTLSLVKAYMDETPTQTFRAASEPQMPQPINKASDSMSIAQVSERLIELCEQEKISMADVSRFEVSHKLPDHIKAML